MNPVVRSSIAAAVVAALFAGGYFLFRSPEPAPVPVSETPPAPIDDAWCASAFAPIGGGGCFAAPSRPAERVPLLVYLHGRYSPAMIEEETVRQNRVAKLATAKGYAVLSMHGTQGECTQPELADMWCWPSNPRNVDHGPAFFERIKPVMAAARARVGASGPNVLLGFSNGAYFAALIATRSLGPFDAIAIAHGGPVQPTRPVGTTPPVLLITADDDPSDGEMRELDAELTQESWAHELVSREGVHALLDWDVDIALTFFDRVQKERLPLTPPLQPFRPRVVKEASAGAGEEEGGEGEDEDEDGGEDEDDDGGS